jgi:hypothetical protein
MPYPVAMPSRSTRIYITVTNKCWYNNSEWVMFCHLVLEEARSVLEKDVIFSVLYALLFGLLSARTQHHWGCLFIR